MRHAARLIKNGVAASSLTLRRRRHGRARSRRSVTVIIGHSSHAGGGGVGHRAGCGSPCSTRGRPPRGRASEPAWMRASPPAHRHASLWARAGCAETRSPAPRTGALSMSTLIAVAYPDAATAERVRAELVQATKEHLLQLEDAVIVEHEPGGKVKLRQAMSTTGTGAAGGAGWGGPIRLLFLGPLSRL